MKNLKSLPENVYNSRNILAVSQDDQNKHSQSKGNIILPPPKKILIKNYDEIKKMIVASN